MREGRGEGSEEGVWVTRKVRVGIESGDKVLVGDVIERAGGGFFNVTVERKGDK